MEEFLLLLTRPPTSFQDTAYLTPILKQVLREKKERATWDNLSA